MEALEARPRNLVFITLIEKFWTWESNHSVTSGTISFVAALFPLCPSPPSPFPYTSWTWASALTYSTIFKMVSVCIKIRNKWTDGFQSSKEVLVLQLYLILSRKHQCNTSASGNTDTGALLLPKVLYIAVPIHIKKIKYLFIYLFIHTHTHTHTHTQSESACVNLAKQVFSWYHWALFLFNPSQQGRNLNRALKQPLGISSCLFPSCSGDSYRSANLRVSFLFLSPLHWGTAVWLVQSRRLWEPVRCVTSVLKHGGPNAQPSRWLPLLLQQSWGHELVEQWEECSQITGSPPGELPYSHQDLYEQYINLASPWQ